MKMPVFKRLALTLAVVLAALPAGARTRKGDKLFKEGQAAEVRQQWDAALDLYEQAVGEDPGDASYLLASRRVRFQAGQYHVDQGQKLLADGKLEEALAEFQRAYATDPSSAIAAQQLKRTLQMIERSEQQPTGEKTNPDPAEAARERQEEKVAAILPVPELKPITAKIDMLRMNNQPVRVLYETVGKLAGVNIIFDPEFQNPSRNSFSVDLSNTTLEQALDYLSVLTKTFWKPLSENTIFLTNDNTTKRRDYEEMVVKAYYLKNPTTPQELGELATVVRTLTDIQRVVPYNSQNMIVVRGEADKVALADKLVSDLDKPKAEVVVDVIVMEANRTRTRDLAAAITAADGTAGLNVPVVAAPRDVVTGGSTNGTVPLSNLPLLDGRDFALTLPNLMLQALMTDRGTKVLQSPELRATNGVKASLKIGDRYPYATGSFQAAVGTAGGVPYANTQFQFADVGVVLDVTPTIHGDDEVSLVVEITISSVRDRIDVGGLTQPVIGQRVLSHTIRLREGEVSLLGGLTQDQDTTTVGGIPGLSSIPLLRRLFSSESVEHSEGELLVALVPHIVRAPEITATNLRGVAAGSQATVKVNYAPRTEPDGQAAGAAPAAPGTMTPSEAEPATPEPKPAAPAEPAGPPALSFQPGTASAGVGDTVTLNLQLSNGNDVFGAPMRIAWDPKILRLNEAALGTLLGGDGQRPIFTRNIRNDAGEVSIMLNRLPGSSGITGSGSLVSLEFQAIAPGSTTVRLTEITVRNSQQQQTPLEAAPVTITVQ